MTTQEKLRILIVVDSYEPGFRAGGPVRSISNMAHALSDHFDFYVLTRNRDHGAVEPYEGIEPDTWIHRPHDHVYYSSGFRVTGRLIDRIQDDLQAPLVYLNSLFSTSTIGYLTRIARRRRRGPTLLAPRGQLDPGALGIHAKRKRLFLSLARLSHIHNSVVWHATNEEESCAIRQIAPIDSKVYLAPNVPSPPPPTIPVDIDKESGSVRVLFLSRVSPKKNLPFLLDVLATVQGSVTLTIAGPRDPGYLDNLRDVAAQLPASVQVKIAGALDHASAEKAILAHHALALPTLGENFGHSIWESIRVGRPVLISDETPWTPSASTPFGWVMPLDRPTEWTSSLNDLIAMNQREYVSLAKTTLAFAQHWFQDARAAERHAAMFRDIQTNSI